jgi:hypothetical protein
MRGCLSPRHELVNDPLFAGLVEFHRQLVAFDIAHADIGEAAFLLEAGACRSSSARWCGNRPSSQPGRNTVELQALGGVQRHDETRRPRRRPRRVHDQRDVLEEAASRFSNSSIERTSSFRFSSRPGASAERRPATCRCSRFVEDHFGQFGVRAARLDQAAPALESFG